MATAKEATNKVTVKGITNLIFTKLRFLHSSPHRAKMLVAIAPKMASNGGLLTIICTLHLNSPYHSQKGKKSSLTEMVPLKLGNRSRNE